MANPTLDGIIVDFTPRIVTLDCIIVDFDTVIPVAPIVVPDPLNKAVNEGAALASASLSVDDVQADPVTITIQAGTEPAWLTRDQALSTPIAVPFVVTFGGTPPFTGSGSSSGSPYVITYRFSDGVNFTDVICTFTVNNVNRHPNAVPGSVTTSVLANASVAVPLGTVTFTDPDLEALTFSVSSGSEPAGITRVVTNTSPGVYDITYTGSVAVVGNYTWKVKGADSGALFDECTYTLGVTASQSVPAIWENPMTAFGHRGGRVRWR